MTMPNTPEGEDKDMSLAKASFEEFANAIKTGNVAEAEAATQKIWQHVAETLDAEPSPWLEAMQDAHRCAAAFDWPAAEEAYTRAVRAGADQPGLECGAYRELSQFHRLFDREALALQTAHLATEAARRENIPSMLAMTLQVEAALHLHANDYTAAWKLIAEAFAALEEGPMHNLERALALLVRGAYLIEHERFPEAEADLTSARGLMEPWSEAHYAGGWQGAFASWWSATARLRSKRGDKPGAAAAWREVVARRRINAELPQLEGPYKHNSLAIALRDLGRALQDLDAPLAEEAFAESRSLRRGIGLPPLP